MTIAYDASAAQYRDIDTGKFISRDRVVETAQAETTRLKVRCLGHARVLLSGKVELAEYQARVAQDLKASIIRNTILGAGGKDRVVAVQYLAAGRQLKEQYKLLDKFARDIADGKLTEKQILARTGQYANAATVAYYEAEKFDRQRIGFNAAMRSLDPQAKHCKSCLRHHTNGQWLSIELVVPSGVDCECRGNCRCRVQYKKLPEFARL